MPSGATPAVAFPRRTASAIVAPVQSNSGVGGHPMLPAKTENGWKTFQLLREAQGKSSRLLEDRSTRVRQFLGTYQAIFARKGLPAAK